MDFLAEVRERHRLRPQYLEDLLKRMEHPICKKCHEQYKQKYPDTPFRIICDGIAGDEDFDRLSKEANIPVEEVRESLDPAFWASRYVKIADQDGDMRPFYARWYQEYALRCTAKYQVDRWGRGLGKSLCGQIKELHKALYRKNYHILIACPAKSQAEKWFNDISDILDNHRQLAETVAQKKQQPYYVIRFYNGSTISIFTTGAESGRKGNSVRTQSPRRVRIDEQDMLAPEDYKALLPLLKRYPESEFHGSSTPTGLRSHFWHMCTQLQNYKELHFPIMVHPSWNSSMEEELRREARIEDVYVHEYLAEFGDLQGGVFKSELVDAAKKHYSYKDCIYNPNWYYFMGVDWNGKGTGTKIRVVGYDPITKIRRLVDAETVDDTNLAALAKIRDLNRKWHCTEVYVDKGAGWVQEELLRLEGKLSNDPDDRKLLHLKTVDFGANLQFNKLVSTREGPKSIKEETDERRTKPFMVEGTVMCFEQRLFEFSAEDTLLEDQFRAYRVKNWSPHGWANTYDAGSVGDHDLDAVFLALLGVEMKFGLYYEIKKNIYLPAVRHLGAPGLGTLSPAEKLMPPTLQEQVRDQLDVPARATPRQKPAWNIARFDRASFLAVPNRASTHPISPSRTSMFRNRPSRSPFGGR